MIYRGRCAAHHRLVRSWSRDACRMLSATERTSRSRGASGRGLSDEATGFRARSAERSPSPRRAFRGILEAMPGYRTQSADTSEHVERMLFAAYREMTVAEKLRRVAELNRACHVVALMGLRERYPGASEQELGLRLGILRLGRDLMRKVYGFAPGEPDTG